MIEWFVPESELERRLLEDPELQRGWAWGSPRHGHPEGAVGRHVQAMLAEIAPDDPLRTELRLLTLLHDTFKVDAREGLPYSPDADHAQMAARFVELDASTLGKDPAFLEWFRASVRADSNPALKKRE